MTRWLLAFLWALAFLAFVLLAGVAQAQVRQSGNVTPGHIGCWTTTGVVQDCGTPGNPFVTGGLGIVSSNAQSIVIDNAKITGPYNQLGMGVTAGAANITLQAFGGATDIPLNIVAPAVNFVIRGANIPFPGPAGPFLSIGGGTLLGPLQFNLFTVWSGLTTSTAIYQNQNMTGAQNGGNPVFLNFLQLNDGIAITNNVIGGGVLYLSENINQTSLLGPRSALVAATTVQANTQNATGGNPAVGYVGAALKFNASVPDNGTSTASYTGNYGFGVNITSQLSTGALNWSQLVGAEVNCTIQTGASARDKICMQIVQPSDDAVFGVNADEAFSVNNQANAIGWKTIFAVPGLTGVAPFRVDGTTTLFDVDPEFAGPTTIAWGFRLRNLTCTNGCFSSPGFNIASDGSGAFASSSAHGMAIGSIATGTGISATNSAGVNNVDIHIEPKGTGGLIIQNDGAGAGILGAFANNAVGATTNYPVLSPGNSGGNSSITLGGTGGSLILATTGALATTATTGFPVLPTTAGPPTGAAPIGSVVVDTNNSHICTLITGTTWHCI